MGIADVFCLARFHSENGKVVIGLGPVLSYIVVPSVYVSDAIMNHPLNGKEKNDRFDIGLRPNIVFRPGMNFLCAWGGVKPVSA